MREGKWPEATEISGIECAGLVKCDPDGRLAPGQRVVAFMGGMGRSINGSYAELTSVPAANVLPVETELGWDALAAIPESYATAWAALYGNLDLKAGRTIVIRGATSALGQAAVNIAAHAGARVITATRNPKRAETLEALGAKEVVLEAPDLPQRLRERHPQGVDAVLELVGNSTVVDSLTMVRRHGRLCLAGFLGGLDPIPTFHAGDANAERRASQLLRQLHVRHAGVSGVRGSHADHRRAGRRWHLQGQTGAGLPLRGDSRSPSLDGSGCRER
jgi:NADPH:quinone reductase